MLEESAQTWQKETSLARGLDPAIAGIGGMNRFGRDVQRYVNMTLFSKESNELDALREMNQESKVTALNTREASTAVNEIGNAQGNAILQNNKVTALPAYQQKIANGNQIFAQASGEEDLVNSIPVGQASSTDVISSAKGTGQAGTRPTWRQSEQDASSDYPGYQTQQSFKDGSPVSNGTKGSSRPDLYTDGHSIEVKNYDVTTSQGRNNLINNVAGQVIKRKTDLPEGTRQTVQIDVRGQNVSREYLIQVRDGIVRKTDNGAEVIFKMN
ncbi:hypothetical protein BM613_14285 [Sulfoacidibacillus thermotolerans]|uniref:Uncharacterized protein n=1 Tax=Sulfoacidibacillus thermotolerans TaxID=1765684 RepID=A0A2U3CRJ6_SULT2|nr:hypothetical protein BM613_14285 [Sulfoacidibacillus thermotolerans]